MSPNDEENTSFLLRNVPRELWGKVKSKAYMKGLSVRAFIIQTLEKEVTSWQKTEMAKSQKES